MLQNQQTRHFVMTDPDHVSKITHQAIKTEFTHARRCKYLNRHGSYEHIITHNKLINSSAHITTRFFDLQVYRHFAFLYGLSQIQSGVCQCNKFGSGVPLAAASLMCLPSQSGRAALAMR